MPGNLPVQSASRRLATIPAIAASRSSMFRQSITLVAAGELMLVKPSSAFTAAPTLSFALELAGEAITSRLRNSAGCNALASSKRGSNWCHSSRAGAAHSSSASDGAPGRRGSYGSAGRAPPVGEERCHWGRD